MLSSLRLSKCKDDKPFLLIPSAAGRKSQQINHSKDLTKCYRQPQREGEREHLLLRGNDFALHSRATCVTKCLWVPVSGLVGRGGGGQGHNKREQSALLGVCRDRRTSYSVTRLRLAALWC